MKNPANVYRLLDERTKLEALQLAVNNAGFWSDLWESHDEEGFWSLSVGPYEVCIDNKGYVVYDFDVKMLNTDSITEITNFLNRTYED